MGLYFSGKTGPTAVFQPPHPDKLRSTRDNAERPLNGCFQTALKPPPAPKKPVPPLVLTCLPESLCTWNFRVQGAQGGPARVTFNHFGEHGGIELAGMSYSIVK